MQLAGRPLQWNEVQQQPPPPHAGPAPPPPPPPYGRFDVMIPSSQMWGPDMVGGDQIGAMDDATGKGHGCFYTYVLR